MKFTLNDYQTQAVGDLLDRLVTAREMFSADHPLETSVALTAPTGSGKTVMAAAVIEALLFGSDRFAFEPDPTAVVIWFSDSPTLNAQSRERLMEASEKLTSNRLIRVRPPFAMQLLDSGKVYFLNTGQLTKNAQLTRGYVASKTHSELAGFDDVASPDKLAWNIWETIANTIEDGDRTVYFVLDEAHRGFNTEQSKAQKTIVRRLVEGDASGQSMPIVLGISATVKRFTRAMAEADERNERVALPGVDVSIDSVQQSGLLKDVIKLEIPDEEGDYATVLVREAAKRLKESEIRWKRHAKAEGAGATVVPLIVFQVQNTPDTDVIGRCLDAIESELPELTPASFRHVLTDGGTAKFGSWSVDYVEPQRVQGDTQIRVLIAKEAISTGWDCPRAEVLVSLRPAKDQDHIAQLLGRMVRTPLARRIPGNDGLNSVDCILPYFDRLTARNVVNYLNGQIDELPSNGGVRVVHDGRELGPNPQVPDRVWQTFDRLPTLIAPQRGVRPVKRLVALAQALSEDGIHSNAIAEASGRVHSLLDELTKQYADYVTIAERNVREVITQRVVGRRGELAQYEQKRNRIVADESAVRSSLDEAKRSFGGDVTQSYIAHLCPPGLDDDEDLKAAYVRTAALAHTPQVRQEVDVQTDALSNSWFDEHDEAIRALSDERQSEYDTIRSLATDPQRVDLRRPKNRIEGFSIADGDELKPSQLVKKHLLADQDGNFPSASFNGWEAEVLALELARENVCGWYRNPGHNGTDSIAACYRDEIGNWRSMHPDFVFFNEIDGEIRASIVDPHGQHLTDSIFKLRGFADFAGRFGDQFDRIVAVAKIDNRKWRQLDLKDPAVRKLIHEHSISEVEPLYRSDLAREYS